MNYLQQRMRGWKKICQRRLLFNISLSLTLVYIYWNNLFALTAGCLYCHTSRSQFIISFLSFTLIHIKLQLIFNFWIWWWFVHIVGWIKNFSFHKKRKKKLLKMIWREIEKVKAIKFYHRHHSSKMTTIRSIKSCKIQIAAKFLICMLIVNSIN